MSSCRSFSSGALATCLGAAILLMAAPARAQETAPSQAKPWYESIGASALLESTYTHNFARPDSSTNQFRVFDTDAGSLRLDVAEVVFQMKASERGAVGFRIDALAGSSIPHISAASGLFRDDVTGKSKNVDLLQAFASYVVPIGRGMKVDAGKFTTHMGYEVVDGPDSTNDNASRSLLFGWTVPISHTGLRITYPLSSTLFAQASAVKGWDNVKDNNGAESFGAQLLYAPFPTTTMALNLMSGAEKPDDDADRRNSIDYWITWKASDRISIALNSDYGSEDGDGAELRRVSWYGVAGYVRLSLVDGFSFTVRAEDFRDPDGERTGTRQTIREVTLTPSWTIGKGFTVRGDLRHDWSNEPGFERRDGHSTGQTTASLNVIYLIAR